MLSSRTKGKSTHRGGAKSLLFMIGGGRAACRIFTKYSNQDIPLLPQTYHLWQGTWKTNLLECFLLFDFFSGCLVRKVVPIKAVLSERNISIAATVPFEPETMLPVHKATLHTAAVSADCFYILTNRLKHVLLTRQNAVQSTVLKSALKA